MREMNDRHNEDRLYTAIVLAFLLGLVALGLLGVAAPLVVVTGLVVAALGIAILQRSLAGRRRRIPAHYVPSVLEGSSTKRRRPVHLRRHRHASPPLRFR